MTMHPSVTLDRIVRAIKRSMHTDGGQGFCIACGRKAKQFCEPDAKHYSCGFKSCGQPAVFAAEQLLFLIAAGLPADTK